MTFVLPNPHSPFADADPMYRHTFLASAPLGAPRPGVLVPTDCERLAVVPDETQPTDFDQLPNGMCPTCIGVARGELLVSYPSMDCRRCEATTHHNGLCAQCRQEQHADWWQADNWARPFRLILRDKRTLDGAVFPGGQAVVIEDPTDALASAAPSLEQLLANYHRAELLLGEDAIRVGTARVQHAVGEYTRVSIELEDTRRELTTAAAAVERAEKLASQWAVLRTYGGAAGELRSVLGGREPSALPAGFTAETCLTVKCAACEYEFDEDENHTIHFVSVEQAHQVLRDHGWTVLADGRAVCDHDDEEHLALLPPVDAPSEPVMTGQTSLDA